MIVRRMIQSTDSLLHKIHTHPFNVQLAEGNLNPAIFIFYLQQDALYLAEFSKALSLTAARLPNMGDSQQCLTFALDAIKAEQTLHANYLNRLCFKSMKITPEQSPTCLMYTHYLLRMASLASVEEAVASLLPCFYIYHEVGKKMTSYLYENHAYADWIRLYASDAFEVSVQAMIFMTNTLASDASEKTKDNMLAAFFKSTQLEWHFWDSAYHQESWVMA